MSADHLLWGHLLVQRNGNVSIRGVYGTVGSVVQNALWRASCKCGWVAVIPRRTRREAVHDLLDHLNEDQP